MFLLSSPRVKDQADSPSRLEKLRFETGKSISHSITIVINKFSEMVKYPVSIVVENIEISYTEMTKNSCKNIHHEHDRRKF